MARRMELHAVPDRQLAVTDPAGRMLTISCGAALHHVRVALAASGWAVESTGCRTSSDPDLLARLTVTGRTEVTPAAVRLLQTLRIRHTDRRPVSDTPVDPAALERLRHTAEAEGSGLHLLRPDDVIELASAAAHAQDVEGLDEAWREELAYWVGGAAGAGLGAAGRRDPGRAGRRPPCPGGTSATAARCRSGRATTAPPGTRSSTAPTTPASAGCGPARRSARSGWPRSRSPSSAGAAQRGGRGPGAPGASCAGCWPTSGSPTSCLRLGIADPDHAGPPHTPRLPADQVVEIVR